MELDAAGSIPVTHPHLHFEDQGSMSTIRFEAKLFKIGSWTILVLPKSASMMLPSRGVVMVEGTINDFPFQAVLEPDGKGSHWLRVDDVMLKASKADTGGTLALAIESTKDWIEPDIPDDFMKILAESPQAHALWKGISPINRWDWIRWLRSTKNPQTRKKRIETALAMLQAGKGRRCCFDRSQCTVPDVSHNGALRESS